MAAVEYKIKFANGQVLSVYQAANQAIGTNPVCTLHGIAGATTLTTDFAPGDTQIFDIIVPTGLTAGGIEFVNVTRGVKTGKGESNLEQMLITNVAKKVYPIAFTGGHIYRLIQTVAGNA